MAPYLSNGQSNKGDWRYTSQIIQSNGEPPWGATVPGGLVVSIALVDQRNVARFTAKSDDGSNVVVTLPNGYFTLVIPAASMSGLCAGLYDVHMKADIGDFHSEFVLGRLPIFEGASI